MFEKEKPAPRVIFVSQQVTRGGDSTLEICGLATTEDEANVGDLEKNFFARGDALTTPAKNRNSVLKK